MTDTTLAMLLNAVTQSPKDAAAQHKLANYYAKQHRYDEALTHYHQALRLAPADADIHFHLGLLFLRQQQLNYAKIQFQNTLTLNDGHVHAYFQLGTLYLLDEAFEEATAAFQKVLSLNPNDQDALTNLGVIALKQQQDQLAIDYFTKTLVLNENNINARNNLAATFIHHDRYENALMHYDVLLQNDPTNHEYLYNSGVAEMALGHLQKAIDYFNRGLQSNPQHTDSLTNLAAIYLKLNDKIKATALLQQVVQLNPDDEIAGHMLRAQRHVMYAETCPNYAKNLFNNYALYYEQHLNQNLHYSVPDNIERLLQDLNLPPFKKILELGCGTGIMGERLKATGDYLAGVDIAGKMLAEAHKKNQYDALIEADITTYLQQTHDNFDLVVAADVLPYIGSLDDVFKALSQHISAQGLLIFSTEISNTADFVLNSTARFSHHQDYLNSLRQTYGFELLSQEKIIGREQDHEPVHMWLMAFKKSV